MNEQGDGAEAGVTPRPTRPARAPRRLAAMLALAAAVFLISSHVAYLDDPWDVSLGTLVSTSYYSASCLAWDEFGVLETRTQPILAFTRGEPSYRRTYHNHPVLPFLATYASWCAFGRDLAALRLPSLVLVILDIVLLLVIGRLLAGDLLRPALAVAAFCCTPAILQYGNLVDPSVWSTTLLIPLTWAYLRWRNAGGRSGYGAYFALALTGALIDWFCYPIALALAIDLIVARRRFAGLFGAWTRAALPFAAGAAVHFAWVLIVTDPASASDRFAYFMSVVSNREVGATIVSAELYFENMSTWIRRCFGWPTLVLGLAGSIVAIARVMRRGAAARFEHATLILFAGGLLPSVIFYVRAALHEFWIDTALPGLAMVVAVAVHAAMTAAGRIARRAGPVLVLVLFGAALVWSAFEARAFRASFQTDDYETIDAWISAEADADDLVVHGGPAESWRFYVDATVIPSIGSREAFDEMARSIGPAWVNVDQVWLTSLGALHAGGDWVRTLPMDPRSYVRRVDGDLELHMVRVDREALRRQLADVLGEAGR